MRILLEIFGQTVRTLWAHKLRSFLTMFGIAWGVGSLLLLVGLGEGFRSGNRKQFDEIGENVMFVWGGRAPTMNGSFTSLRQYYLTYRDYLDIVAKCPDVKIAAPVISRGDVRAVSDYYQSSGQLLGVPANFNDIRYLPISEGRWLNDLDVAQKRAVVVIGDEARRVLFPGWPSVGSTILLNGVRFQVIGALKRIGHGDNNTRNLQIFIPFSVMRENFPPLKVGDIDDAISFVNYQPKTRDLHETAKQEVHKVLGTNHHFDSSNPDSFDEWDTIRTVDAIGKIMLVAVADRTREIGLRKALGATSRSILFQFFAEGAFLTLISGGVGMGCAAGFMALLALLPQPQGFDTPRLVPTTAVLAIGSLAFAGIVAGLYPARKAALLEPVEALRRE